MASRVPGDEQRPALNPCRTLIAVTQLVGRRTLQDCRSVKGYEETEQSEQNGGKRWRKFRMV